MEQMSEALRKEEEEGRRKRQGGKEGRRAIHQRAKAQRERDKGRFKKWVKSLQFHDPTQW